jgi:hypothetical protein
MNRPSFIITKSNGNFNLELYSADDFLMARSKPFATLRECEKFIDILKVHMCFQTNFCRSKNRVGQYGFEIRTCWDELIGCSLWFQTREDRELAMQQTFVANKDAVYVDKKVFVQAPQQLSLLVVA